MDVLDSRAVFAFDKNDRLKKITDAAMQSISYTYDGAGNLAKAVQPGNTVSYTYDKNNRPVTVERLFGVDTRASEQITYDALGRIKTHTGTSAIPEYTFSRGYAYDALGQLASYGDGENTESYRYDTLGNRTEKQTDGKTAAAYQYNAMNQLTAMTQGEETYSYLYDRRGNLTEERLGEQVLKSYAYNATNRMISGKNLVSGTKSEYTYNGLLARVRKTSGAAVSSYIPDYPGGIYNDLVTQTAGAGTVNAVYGQGYGRVSQRFMPEAGTGAADTYFQHDLYGSTLFAVDAQGVVRHHASHDIWGMPETICDDISIASGLRFTTYDYDDVLGKHFAHARMYDPSQGRMLGADPVKRGLNGYAYCDNDPVNQTDPTGEVANILLGGIAGGIIGGAFGFAGSALSQIAAGNGFSARKAWGAAANGAIVGAARGALIGSGAGIPLAFGVDFAAGMAGSLAEQKIAGGRLSPVRAAVDGAFNAAGGRLYGTSPLRNAKDAFMRGALEGALKGGAYNIADVLDNKLRNAYGSGGRRNPGTRNPWNKKNQTPWNSRNPRPTGSRCPQSDCIRPKPLKGMRNPKRGSSGANGNGNTTHRNDRFSLGSFVRDVVSGAVMGGLASVTFYGAGKAVEALKDGIYTRNRYISNAGIPLEEIPYSSGELNYSEIMHALRASNSIEGDTVAKLLKRKKIQVMVSEYFSDGRAGSYFFPTRRIYLYKKVKLPSGKWVAQNSKSAAGTLAHETKHWIDRVVKSKKDEFNAYMWQKKVDLSLNYTAEDIVVLQIKKASDRQIILAGK